MANNYNNIAHIYDFISRLVYGNALVKAQTCLLQYVPAGSHVLIVGGGTGWILEEITKLHPAGLIIDYVESSAQMIEISAKRNHGANHVNFINLRAEDYVTNTKYDVILTPFFFDNFQEDKIQIIFTKLDILLKQNGRWLYVDFIYDRNKSPWWQKLLLKSMYLFFRITSNIETKELVNMNPFFDPLYDKVAEVLHFHRFVRSVVYKKK